MRRGKEPSGWKAEIPALLLYIHLALVIRLAFFPRDLVDGRIPPLVFDPETAFPFRINLLPLVHLFEYDSLRDMVWNIAGNAVLFLPCGILLPMTFRKLDKGGKVIYAGAFLSLCIEILQLPFYFESIGRGRYSTEYAGRRDRIRTLRRRQADHPDNTRGLQK